MTGPYRDIQVRLHRDAFNTPWGFRLQGGKDFKAPLTVQRVFVGSPAESELSRGDVLVSIENYDATTVTHKRAQDIIKGAGGTLSLRIRRGLQARSRSTSPPQQTVNFSQGGRKGPDSMLNRINQNLTQSIWSGGGPSSYNNDYYEDQDYQPVSVNSLKQNFAPKPQQHRSYNPQSVEDEDDYQPLSVKQLQSMYDEGNFSEPGWAPGLSNASKPSGWSPVKGPPQQQRFSNAPAYNTAYVDRTPVNARPQQPRYEQPPHLEEDHGPAWAGSLKSSGGPKKWEVQAAQQFVPDEPGWAPAQPQQHQAQHGRQRQRPAPHHMQGGGSDIPQIHQPKVQRMHYGPGGTQEYQQLDPHSAEDSDTARVAHLQYNSPIGLYSRDNVQQALAGQTSGKPGDGTMRVEGMGTGKTLDLAKSDVYRLIHEQEDGRPQSARYRDPNRQGEMSYQGYQDHSRQSRSMHALELQMHTDQPDASDF